MSEKVQHNQTQLIMHGCKTILGVNSLRENLIILKYILTGKNGARCAIGAFFS